MKALLLLAMLALPVRAQEVFPEAIADPSMQRNLDFIYQEMRAQVNTATVPDARRFTSSATFDGGAYFNGTVSISTSINNGTEIHYTSSGTVTGYDVCVASASLTLASSVRVQIKTSGCAMAHSGTNGYFVLDVLVDGARPGPYSGTYHMVGGGNVGGVYFPMPIDYTTPALAAGAHTFCLAPGEEGSGTATWNWLDAGLKGCYLRIKEDR